MNTIETVPTTSEYSRVDWVDRLRKQLMTAKPELGIAKVKLMHQLLQRPRADFGWFINQLFPEGGNGVEVGVLRGHFSEAILDAWPNGHLTSIDCWRHQDPAIYPEHNPELNAEQAVQDDCYYDTINRLERFRDRSTVMREFSTPASIRFADRSLAFVYLDANHSFEATTEAIEVWAPKVKLGGLLAGHDYNFSYPGVIAAVNQYAQVRNVYLFQGCNGNDSWFLFL